MNWKKILPWIGIIIFIYLIYKIGLDNILNSFKNINYLYLFIALAFIPLIFIFQVLKWLVIIKEQGINLKFSRAFRYYLTSMFYALVTPARLGALLRASYMQKEVDKPWIVCASGIILERILDVIVLLCLSTIGIIFLSKFFGGTFLLTAMIWIIIFIIVCVILLWKPAIKFILKKFFYIFVPNKFKKKSNELFTSFYGTILPVKKLVLPFILTFLTWAFACIQQFFIAKSLGVDLSWLIFLIMLPIASLAVLIPISISGLGTREAVLVYIFSFFGVAAGKVVGFSLIGFLINFVSPAIVALFTMRKY